MNLLRGVAAIVLFLAGLITLAGALVGVTIIMATAQQTHQPISLWDLAGGLVAGVIGFLLLFGSRAIDPEGGPVRSYRDRPIKPRARK